MKMANFAGLVFATLALSIASTANAHWYAGVTGGTTKSKLNADGLNTQFLDFGFTTSTTQTDGRDSASRFFGGYQFNRYLALETGYADLGEVRFGATVTPAGTLEKRIKTSGFDVSAVALYPVTDKLNVFARAGAFMSERKTQLLATGSIELLNGVITDSKERQSKTTLGGGLTYRVTNNIALRAEYAQIRKFNDELLEGTQNIETFALGLVYHFK
jgi:OmpA-OmpF porin, OOP family